MNWLTRILVRCSRNAEPMCEVMLIMLRQLRSSRNRPVPGHYELGVCTPHCMALTPGPRRLPIADGRCELVLPLSGLYPCALPTESLKRGGDAGERGTHDGSCSPNANPPVPPLGQIPREYVHLQINMDLPPLLPLLPSSVLGLVGLAS
jgi:hypothetical protein